MDYKVKNKLNNLLRAVEFEREEERERHHYEMQHLTGYQREKKGRAIIDLHKKSAGRLITGEYLYQFKKKGTIESEITVGDQVIISQHSPMDKNNPNGIVYELKKKSITVALTKQLRMTNANPIRIDLSVNDTTYMRMEEALLRMKSLEYSKFHTIFSGQYKVSTNPSHHVHYDLNTIQNDGVNLAYNCNGFYSIQGPPGTGKTFTAAHLIKDIIESGKKVIISADSNAAVDHLIRHCILLGLDPLRIGNPIRVNEDLKPYTLDYKVFHHALYEEISQNQTLLDLLKEEQSTMKRPEAKDTRGYSYSELVQLLETNQSGRGLSKMQIREMKPFLKVQKKIDTLYHKIQTMKQEIQEYLLMKHPLIATTNSTAGSMILDAMHFDWAIIDEAAQASMPSALIPISKANRFVLIGDHYQLPPVVLNEEAKELGLDQSLMDYLADLYPYFMTRLTKQYRMHHVINDLVSNMFYNGELIPDASVKNRRVLKGQIIDIHHVEGEEMMQKDSKSFYNDLEIDKVAEVINYLFDQGIQSNQIAVISPYKAQTRKLQGLYPTIEIDTVDAFQGREKDVVIISFVRSNDHHTLGFLTDFRRLNVSISRAKSKLILIGNIKQLKQNRMYRDLLDYINLLE
ncbi:MAG: IGHMBP2 family helicase [Clostridia bacterium]|nr:IGHMBP2 family helicase [Clostridia bacterium]